MKNGILIGDTYREFHGDKWIIIRIYPPVNIQKYVENRPCVDYFHKVLPWVFHIYVNVYGNRVTSHILLGNSSKCIGAYLLYMITVLIYDYSHTMVMVYYTMLQCMAIT